MVLCKVLPYFSKGNELLHFLGTAWFVISFAQIRGLISHLKHSGKEIDLSWKDAAQDLFSKDDKRVIEKLKHESSLEIEMDKAVFLGSKTYVTKKTIELNWKTQRCSITY